MYYLHQNKSFLIVIIIAFVLLAWLSFDQQWAPSYPVEGQVFFRPSSIRVKAPFSGIVKILYYHEGSQVIQNDKLLVLENLHHLSIDEGNEKIARLQKQRKALKAEIAYQKKLLLQIKPLVKNKLLAENEYHTKRQQYYQLQSNYQDVDEKISTLMNQFRVAIKAPSSGKLLHINHKIGDEISKNKVLLKIKPYKSKPWIKLKLPFDYQEVIEIGQLVKLSKLNQSFIKTYPYEAIIREIYFVSNRSNQPKYYIAKAQFKHHFDLQESSPLRGFVIGKSQKIWSWLISNWD